MKKVVLAYSGGLDTSCIVKWLSNKGYSVVAFAADVGQDEDFSQIKKKALASGAVKAYVRDLKDEFINDFIWPSLKASAVYEGQYFLATALSRPLIAKHLVDIAVKEKADYIAHGCTGKGNDQVRFEVSAAILNSKLQCLAPVRTWEFKSREEEIDYAKANNIPVNVTKAKPYSIDENLWGVSIECGVLENPWNEPPEDAYLWTTDPAKAPNKASYCTIEFKKGIPTHLNGKALAPQKLIKAVCELASKNGVGRSDMIENRLVGIKSREIYEAPAGTVLHAAHKALESMVLDRDTMHFKEHISLKYAELIYNGLWYSKLKKALDKFVEETQGKVTGTVKMKLYKGRVVCVARKSPNSLYREEMATYTEKDKFDQKLSEGFVKLWGLPHTK